MVINPFKQCKEYGIPLWQCPQFLFLILGAVIIISIVATNIVARRFVPPEIVALIVLGVTGILFIIKYAIISSFERVAESSRAKSDFISIMSHRLRSPLSSVKWHLDLLTSKIPEDSLLEIKKQNEKMIRVVNDLIELNNIEDNNVILNPSSFSLKDLVRELTQNTSVFIASPESLPNVFADRIKIRNIISHLLDNAGRYSFGKGKTTVTLEQSGRHIKCSVSDEGIGIPKNEREEIFSKFFRSKGNLQYQTEGTGAGLFIAKNIVKRSGGKIGFNSIEGRGSTFWFTIPVVKT